MSLRVTLVAAQLCARVPGGTGRYTAELLKGLNATRPPDAHLTAVTATPCEVDTPVPTRRLPVPYVGLARLWERGLPPRLGGDVVHAPTLLVPPTGAKTRLVVTVHDVVPWTHPETLTPRGVTFHRAMAARAATRADLLVTPTEAVAVRVRELLDPACPVVAIPPGVSGLAVDGEAASRREAVGAPSGGYALFVGTAEPRKGLDVLLDALAMADLAELTLVVAGPRGWGDVDVATEGARRGLGARVVVTGRVDDETLAALYQGASVLVQPSRAEGFGLPLLEAMSLGAPVVISDDPALREVGGAAVEVAPVGDPVALAAAVARVVESPDLAQRLRENGRLRAAEFSWATTAERLWLAYRDL